MSRKKEPIKSALFVFILALRNLRELFKCLIQRRAIRGTVGIENGAEGVGGNTGAKSRNSLGRILKNKILELRTEGLIRGIYPKIAIDEIAIFALLQQHEHTALSYCNINRQNVNQKRPCGSF